MVVAEEEPAQATQAAADDGNEDEQDYDYTQNSNTCHIFQCKFYKDFLMEKKEYLDYVDLFIVAFDVRDRDSFDYAEQCLDFIQKSSGVLRLPAIIWAMFSDLPNNDVDLQIPGASKADSTKLIDKDQELYQQQQQQPLSKKELRKQYSKEKKRKLKQGENPSVTVPLPATVTLKEMHAMAAKYFVPLYHVPKPDERSPDAGIAFTKMCNMGIRNTTFNLHRNDDRRTTYVYPPLAHSKTVILQPPILPFPAAATTTGGNCLVQ